MNDNNFLNFFSVILLYLYVTYEFVRCFLLYIKSMECFMKRKNL